MRAVFKLAIGLLLVAGIVQVAISAKQSGPSGISSFSIAALFAYSALLFLLCLRPFARIGLNTGKFDIDAISFANSRNFFTLNDRWAGVFDNPTAPPK